MLQVKKLDPRATMPTVAHPGEDLAYDIYALKDTSLVPGQVAKVPTGIAVAAFQAITVLRVPVNRPMGLLIRDRSSMAAQGITVSGGVIDAGYRGEIVVMLTAPVLLNGYLIKAGDKIAQLIPMPVLTGPVEEVDELPSASRGEKGFGSSGR